MPASLVSFRIGAIDYARQTTYNDFSTTVPRLGDEKAREPRVKTEQGDLFLVHLCSRPLPGPRRKDRVAHHRF